ncbi:uncharacterized protein [Amphiura filiformis]|uniref:uncharacterized protein n=1 Tax=Amphiura filiformis TaxID=82378 RepID=UPI003B222B10
MNFVSLLCIVGLVGSAIAIEACRGPLGVADGRISDDKITASTEWATNHGATNARLNRKAQGGTTGAWSAKANDDKQWIQAELSTSQLVTAVQIQGRPAYQQWVTKYKVQSSTDGEDWEFVDGGLTFDGNTDQETVVTNFFKTPVTARYIRIRPTEWNNHISMRFELLGCEDQGDGCTTGWPIVNRGGPDSNGWTMASPDQKFTCSGQVTAWKYQGKSSRPFRAIVFRPTGGADTEFEIVGINDIPAGAANTPVNYVVPENDRITVAIGDVIGWSFGGGVITYNGGGSYKVRWVGGNLHAGLAATQNVNINGGVQQREYSIEATVTSDPTVTACRGPLGVADGRISDDKITASTEWATNHGATNARLNRKAQGGTTGAWSAKANDDKQWIQAELSTSQLVTAVQIQGRPAYQQWVTKYKVQSSTDGEDWEFVDGGLTFDGNTDQETVVTNFFKTPVTARYIRIRPTEWNNHISMRFELLGCEDQGDGCTTGWPIVNRGGPDSNGWTMASPDQKFTCSGQVTAWKYQGKSSRPFRAIVFRPTGGADTEFEIVGINDIPAGAANTPVNYVVPENDRITVAIGDVIGWSFGGGVITYNGGGSYKVRWVGGNLHAGLAATQNVNINGGVQQREYSIEATVTSDPTVTACRGPLGVADGRISDDKITASTEWATNHGATNARLNRKAQGGTTGAWSAKSQ